MTKNQRDNEKWIVIVSISIISFGIMILLMQFQYMAGDSVIVINGFTWDWTIFSGFMIGILTGIISNIIALYYFLGRRRHKERI